MKRRFGVLAATLAAGCAVVISGCAGCSGCAATKNIAALNSNWYANTGYKKIQPTFVDQNEEIITYKVTQDIATALNDSYSVRYSDGTYKTTFYATAFDKTKYAATEYADAYPENLTVYYYKTELNIGKVTFKVGDDERDFEGDKVITECYFLSVEDYLRPLYSHEEIKSTSPAAYNVKSIDEAYVEHEYEYTTYYSYDGAYAKTVYNNGKENIEKPVVQLSKSDNTVFDANALNVAVRASRLSPDLSQTISLYTPSGNLQNYAVRGGTLDLGSERLKIESELIENKLFVPEKDDEGNNKPIDTVAVGVTYGGDLSGVAQIYWFAAINNNKNNRGRATMLKMSVPVPYSLGTLNYTLDNIESTLYND